ncbi:hypothetical protein [Paenibacillus tengchongensis]|uniref:hypothetical protein n=1 Tax=Paenibacillus tengchongensis TaxID=2608684 RepID=UPI00124E3B3F|nr:hypothetical protein [Paenibacillus tengchongensis]
MNHNWFADLYEICNNDPFRRKILLVDHYNQGEQWLKFSSVEKEMLKRIAGDRLFILPQTEAFPSSLQNGDHVAI